MTIDGKVVVRLVAEERERKAAAKRGNGLGPVTRDAAVLERARAYVARMPEAISGQGGHDAAYAVALAARRGFALSDAVALELMREYNTRCKPPWTERELEHKVASAAAANRVGQDGDGWLRDAPLPGRSMQPGPYSAPRETWDSEDRARRAEPKAKPLTAVERSWTPLPIVMLTTRPPVRRWLLRHPTLDGRDCPPAEGDGLLPLGKAGLLVADGGVGKTMALVALAVSVVTGRPWLGHFAIAHEARRGRVLLALAEEDAEEVHRRVFDVAQAYRLTPEECARCAAQIVALPLAGQPVALTTMTGGAVLESPELAALRAKLAADAGEHGWSLVVLDPLARWAGLDAEADNALATRFVQAVEGLCSAPGAPTALVAHHSSKDAVRAGSVDSRGVTGLRNGFRWEGTLRADGAGVAFRQTKSNYSRPMAAELALVRLDGGLLRVPTAAEVAERQARAEDAQADALDGDVGRLMEVLRRCPDGWTGQGDALALAAGLKRGPGRAALATAIADGRILRTGTTRNARLTLAGGETGESARAAC